MVELDVTDSPMLQVTSRFQTSKVSVFTVWSRLKTTADSVCQASKCLVQALDRSDSKYIMMNAADMFPGKNLLVNPNSTQKKVSHRKGILSRWLPNFSRRWQTGSGFGSHHQIIGSFINSKCLESAQFWPMSKDWQTAWQTVASAGQRRPVINDYLQKNTCSGCDSPHDCAADTIDWHRPKASTLKIRPPKHDWAIERTHTNFRFRRFNKTSYQTPLRWQLSKGSSLSNQTITALLSSE